MDFKKIGFYGLGLIGGSLAKTIRRFFPEKELLAYDINTQSLQQALDEKVIDQIATQRDFAACDLLFLCAPVHTNIEFLKELKPYLNPDCLLSDVGSVKGEMHHKVHELGLDSQFIGGHPMAGSERSGYQSSTSHLFENVYFILTPTDAASEDKLTSYQHFVESLRAIPLILDSECHDFVTASISHVPHVIAASLVNMVQHLDSADETMKTIAAGGFKDITRIASSSPVMWQQICLTNKEQILRVLKAFKKEISDLEERMEQEQKEAIYDFFDSSKNYRDTFSTVDRGPLKKIHYM